MERKRGKKKKEIQERFPGNYNPWDKAVDISFYILNVLLSILLISSNFKTIRAHKEIYIIGSCLFVLLIILIMIANVYAYDYFENLKENIAQTMAIIFIELFVMLIVYAAIELFRKINIAYSLLDS